jgi:uncharacterized protein YkwD
MRPRPIRFLTRRRLLATALGVACSVTAGFAGGMRVPGTGQTVPSSLSSTSDTGLSALSNGAQTSVTKATLLVSRLAGADEADAESRASTAPAKANALVEYMNGARSAAGSPELLRDSELDAVALVRAQDLLALNYFDHYGPDGESAFTELRARGIRYLVAGENLARNNHDDDKTVTVAFESLMASPGHHANIIEPRYHRVGVAAVPYGDTWLYVTIFTN